MFLIFKKNYSANSLEFNYQAKASANPKDLFSIT